jgi:hypothetical protein
MQLRFGHLGSSKNQNFTPNFSWIRRHNKYPTAKYSKFLDAGFVIIRRDRSDQRLDTDLPP